MNPLPPAQALGDYGRWDALSPKTNAATIVLGAAPTILSNDKNFAYVQTNIMGI